MSGAIPPLPQYVSMVWYSVKAQGQLYLFTSTFGIGNVVPVTVDMPSHQAKSKIKSFFLTNPTNLQ
jgi:hypothetical protein